LVIHVESPNPIGDVFVEMIMEEEALSTDATVALAMRRRPKP
jgi:hypothetical protein